MCIHIIHTFDNIKEDTHAKQMGYRQPQLRTHTHSNPNNILFSQSHYRIYKLNVYIIKLLRKREILALSQELRQENNVMDNIWYRNPSKSEVIGRCGGNEKTE